ncbi:MAG: phosphoglycerate kinase [Phototrophicaceae bacterium]|jgi:phosphoglycerate kinase
MNKMTVRDVNLAGKRVLVRNDFNVPLKNGQVSDDTRIRAAIPTLQYILEQKPKALVLMSHLGRPDGAPDPEASLAPVAPVLAKYLGVEVHFAADCIGEVAEQALANLPEGGVLLLENTRFHKGETKNYADFSEQLAKLGDVLVNDAFGTAHRAHASNVGVAAYIPAYAGLLMEKEIDYLATAVESPKRPFVAILGGAKVSDKIAVIEALLGKVDLLLIGGGMANTFFKAQGLEMGGSLVEADAIETAKMLLEKSGGKLVLPVDAVIGNRFAADADIQVVQVSAGVPAGWAIYDIGPETIALYQAKLKDAKTVLWNGPMGVFELEPFAAGTRTVAQALVDATKLGATTIVGGGDSAAAMEDAGLAEQVSHVSTGGGASLELLEGKLLPGLAAIQDKA